jgi:glycosyltransferase involved in cell wall biosynthesis
LSYFYYPAQFWAHKNHYNLLLAFKKLVSEFQGEKIKLVFSGSDRGNKPYVQSVIRQLQLNEHVIVLGFVSNEQVFTLYKHALALVMPTFLGPTNMPVLEAMHLGVPVICSDLTGHRETCGDGAIYVHPHDVDNWYRAMRSMLDNSKRETLILKATAIHEKSRFNIQHAIESLEAVLVNVIAIRKTFY